MKTQSLGFIGTALAIALTGTAVHAAETGTPSGPQEIRMSPEGMQILCQSFPMNSRCTGNSTPNSQNQRPASEAAPAPGSSEAQPNRETPAPGSNTDPSQTTPTPGSNEVQSDEMTPAPGGSDAQPGQMTPAPSGSDAQPRM